jgi:sugar phosphate isomerase/epimerase
MGLLFAAEMHDDTLADTGATARRLVELVGRSNFRLNFQPGSLEHEDQMARLDAVLPFVVHVHCQNFRYADTGVGRKQTRVHLDEGVINYASLLGRLRDVGYEGYLAVEFAADEGEGKEHALHRDLSFLQSL